MTKVVASQPYCLENSNQLTRPGSDSFYHIDGSNVPIIIDKHQAKRLYRLQRAPNVNTSLHLDSSDVGYETQGYYESTVRKQIKESSDEPTASIYHRPTDMSDISMAKFSFGKARADPQRIVPSQLTTFRNHPLAITKLRYQEGFNSAVEPRFNDRLVPDRALRARIGPGGALNPLEDCEQAEKYFRYRRRLTSQPSSSYNPRKLRRSMTNEFKRDELARHFMYTSAQQATYDEVPWDSKLPPILPIPLTTHEADGSDPFLFKSKSLSSLYDIRTQNVLEWDRAQLRDGHFVRKPFANVAPLSRAQQISGYSGVIGGHNIQDIDNPTVNFEPFTVVRTEQPKLGIKPFTTNIPHYTGKSYWAKTDPVSHYDQSGHAYTTTAAFHKPLPVDPSLYRHTGLNGQLSRAVTTVMPQNPFNQIAVNSTTVNGSLDTRPHYLIRQLPAKTLPSTKDNTQNEEQAVNNETNH